MKDGTLGRAYARFLDDNRIKPLVISPEIKARFHDHPYALRYTTTHDLHHVLTGFDTGLAGEIGVLAFNVGQGSAPVSRWLFRLASFFFVVLAPSEVGRIWHNVRVGLELGARAELVIAAPLESSFGEPLAEVRAKLRRSPILASSRRPLERRQLARAAPLPAADGRQTGAYFRTTVRSPRSLAFVPKGARTRHGEADADRNGLGHLGSVGGRHRLHEGAGRGE